MFLYYQFNYYQVSCLFHYELGRQNFSHPSLANQTTNKVIPILKMFMLLIVFTLATAQEIGLGNSGGQCPVFDLCFRNVQATWQDGACVQFRATNETNFNQWFEIV